MEAEVVVEAEAERPKSGLLPLCLFKRPYVANLNMLQFFG